MKRKRANADEVHSRPVLQPKFETSPNMTHIGQGRPGRSTHIQIVTGSYDRALHGMVARLDYKPEESRIAGSVQVSFHDNFLFHAHTAAIRCLAISPISDSTKSKSGHKALLATGGTDERVNVYQLDALAPVAGALLPLHAGQVLSNSRNREIGSLLHHSSSVNALLFTTKSKLLSAAGDSTISITRTRDWTVLSTIKAPVPRPVGRPSGDTAGPGETPSGINDFAVHPSRKLMISVGKGERCMRLWNLVTGKKAGVLTFEKELLRAVGEGKWGRGEGMKVVWNARGDEFAVAFERGVAVFDMNSTVKGIIRPSPATKIHQIKYWNTGLEPNDLLALSTEHGKVLLFSTCTIGYKSSSITSPFAELQYQAVVGGSSADANGRVKDFVFLEVPSSENRMLSILITAGSNGCIRAWNVDPIELTRKVSATVTSGEPPVEPLVNSQQSDKASRSLNSSLSVGDLIGEYMTSSRITCLDAFIMLEPVQAPPESEQTLNDSDAASTGEFEGFD